MSIELYRFAYGATVEAYTTAETSVTHSGTTYVPLAIQRGTVEASQEIERSEVPVDVPRDTPVALLFRAGEAPQQVALTILRGDAITGGYAAFWSGFVASASFSGSVVTLSCSPLMSLLRRQAPRQRYSSMCRWSLYDSGCGVSPVPHTRNVTINSIASPTEFSVTGSGIVVSANSYRSGTITFGGIRYLVTSSTGLSLSVVSITTSQPVPGLVIGLAGQIARGCDHTLDGCDTFSNVPRFGGFPLLPRPVRY